MITSVLQKAAACYPDTTCKSWSKITENQRKLWLLSEGQGPVVQNLAKLLAKVTLKFLS